MIKIMLLYLEKLIHGHITLHDIIVSYGVVLIFSFMYFVMLAISIISRDFSSPKEIKNYTILSLLYLAFQGFLLSIIIMNISISKYIYFYLKNLINIKLILLDNEFIIVYTSIVFFFFILTVIYILIRSYINEIISFINTKYNLQIILTLTIFGIIGIIYSLLLNNLRYVNIINLTDIYLIFLFSTILGMVYIIFGIGRYTHYIINSGLYYDNLFIKNKNTKEINVKIMKRIILAILILVSLFIVALTFWFNLTLITSGFIPWYAIIFIVFYLYIIFEIIAKKYFTNKETFYQDLYKLNKYFNKRLLLIFGVLAFVAVFDALNLFLLKNYTLQIILQPKIIESNLLLQASLGFPVSYIVYFLFYYLLYIIVAYIGYNGKKKEIKEIQVRSIITLLSYSVLFIVFLINLML
jgi:hypothetical protein